MADEDFSDNSFGVVYSAVVIGSRSLARRAPGCVKSLETLVQAVATISERRITQA